METNHTLSHWIANFVSGGAVLSACLGWAPAFAAMVGLVWYTIQIYESSTVQRWIASRRAVKLARLKARVLMLEARSKPALPGPED